MMIQVLEISQYTSEINVQTYNCCLNYQHSLFFSQQKIQLSMKLKNLNQILNKVSQLTLTQKPKPLDIYKPTLYLHHPFLQSIYNLAEPKIQLNFFREKLFFQDGGHISLDWGASPLEAQSGNPPILFMMHGLTGGSEMNYIKVMFHQAFKNGYRCVCLNSRGINNHMTSPIPFTGLEHHELETALDRIELYYPNSPIYMVGTSFGGNYLIRYLIKQKRKNIKALVALAPPFDTIKVVDDMSSIYQKFFVKRYIEQTVLKHPQMYYWENIGLVNMNQVKKSQSLRQFHGSITTKLLGLETVDQLLSALSIKGEDIQKLQIPTLLMTSKDDPIVSYKAFPYENINRNSNIKFVATEKGGHVCWFHGLIPKRWYPKPTLDFFKQVSKNETFI